MKTTQNDAAKAAKAVTTARTAMVLDDPFFGSLALRLKVVADESCDTAWTDGTRMGYNPAFVLGLSMAELKGVIGHEVMHCAAGHPWRRSGREMRQWNKACDYAINPELLQAGYELPAGCLQDSAFDGHGAEWIFDRLPPEEEQGENGEGEGQGGGVGEVRDAGSGKDQNGEPKAQDAKGADGQPDQTPDATEEEWQQAVQQAAMAAQARGSESAAVERIIGKVSAPRVDWRSVLRRFVTESARADYTWRMPNTRYLAGGLFLPSLRSEEMPPVAVAVDTSGSIDEVMLQQFTSELAAVLEEVQPKRTHAMAADARVQAHRIIEQGEPLGEFPMVGGGGTDFRPVFRAMDGEEEQPCALIYLTDLDGTFPTEAPAYPVLWVAIPGTRIHSVPFGELVEVPQ